MQRVSRATATTNKPAPPAGPGEPGFFTGGDPVSGQAATIPGYEWFNTMQEELIAVVSAAGLSPDRADDAQVLAALRRLFGGAVSTVSINSSLTTAQAGLVLIDAAANAVTVALPAANTAPLGCFFRLLRVDATANAVSIAASGGSTINGSTAIAVSGQFAGAILFSDGARWRGFALGGLSRLGLGAGLENDGGENARVKLADSSLTRTAAGLAVMSGGLVPPGCIAHFAMTTPPTGWLKANGVAVSRATYAALFAAIGVTFGGGDGATTFNLPDFRGEFLRGWDDGRGVDSGRGFGSAQVDDLKQHRHTAVAQQAAGYQCVVSGSAGYADPVPVGNTGYYGGAETRPRNIAALVCIKH